jgi:hypothetical protein
LTSGGVAEVWLSNWNPLLKRVCRIANNTSRTSPAIASSLTEKWLCEIEDPDDIADLLIAICK